MQLSAERDIDKLLDLILQKSREITGADAGSLYLVERATENGDGGDDQLRFKLAQNDTMPLPFEEQAMPLDKSSIAGYVAVTGADRRTSRDAYHPPAGTSFQHQPLLRRGVGLPHQVDAGGARCATTRTP